VWVTNCRDATNVGQRELVLVISIRNGTGFHDVVLSNCAPCFSRRELAFDSQLELKVLSTFIAQLAQHGNCVILSEDSFSIDADKVGSFCILLRVDLCVAHILSAVLFSLTPVT